MIAGGGELNSVEIFHLPTLTFSQGPEMPEREFHGGKLFELGEGERGFLVFGGKVTIVSYY